jgi:isopentenyl-diphosphate Delta-isomerase
MEERVILVNENDVPEGTMEKMEAHKKGRLHRAFSIFIVNSKGELLLQQRAAGKYHSAQLWTNTCCSHPAPGEEIMAAAGRRLLQEMGMEVPLSHLFHFHYRAELQQNLVENEIDHVLFGVSDTLPILNEQEVMAYRYETIANLRIALQHHPDQYTAWFKICFDRVIESILPLLPAPQ